MDQIAKSAPKLIMRKYLTNKPIIFATFLIQLLVVFDLVAVLYVVWVETSVSFVGGFDLTQGILLIGTVMIVTIIINFIFILLSLTKLRTTTVFIPMGIAMAIFMYFFMSVGGIALAGFGPFGAGLLFGVYYALIFYGPAIWFYFRYRMPFIAVGWLSILFLSSLLIANALKLEGSGKLTSLLRPDYLIIAGVFYLVVMLLLIIDNAQALSRWKKLPSKSIRLPFRTLFPIVLVLIIVTVLANAISPVLWKVIWEQIDEGKAKQVEQEDIPHDAIDGRTGNLKIEDDGTVKMDPNQELKSEVNAEKGSGKILFTVQLGDIVSYDGTIETPYYEIPEPHYWKMENMDSYSDERGFYNDFSYDEHSYTEKLTKNRWFDYLAYDYSSRTETLSQLISFVDLETHWVIGRQRQEAIRLLVGDERAYFEFENGTITMEKNKPWSRGDSYEIESAVSSVDVTSPFDIKYLRLTEEETGINSINPYSYDEEVSSNNSFNDYDIGKLADEITYGIEYKIDKALAIQDYLRANYTYNLKPGNPHSFNSSTAGKDRLHYFLFERKEGYCTYFASAMVALLRSEGIPSRVVGGFAEGSYSDKFDSYIVTTNDAHAWVEIYFDDYGWITFDPTPASSEEEQQKQEDLGKQLTEDLEKQLEEIIKDAVDKKYSYDFPDGNGYDYEPPDPFEVPKWMEDLAKDMQEVMVSVWNLIKILIPICCCIISLLIIFIPPMRNQLLELYLLGEIRKREDREQIKVYFELIKRKLKFLDGRLASKKGETALQYYKRLSQVGVIHPYVLESLHSASVLYNRAAFRHMIREDDKENMQLATETILSWLDQNTPVGKRIANLWRL